MSALDPSLIRFTEMVPPGANWSHVLKRGTTLRLIDTEGGANVSALFYNFELTCERLNVPDSLKSQHIAQLTKGSCLYSDMGRVLVSITEDTCGWHDPLAGCSNARGVAAKYGVKTYQEARNEWFRNAHDGFLAELGKYNLGERDLAMNVNFFNKVTVNDAGELHFHPGNSHAGAFVDLRAEMNTLVILNTCVHPLDPSAHYAPKPVQLAVWSSPPLGPDDLCRTSRPENGRGFILTERYFQ
ncbi:MAG: urea amidolyase associated protein UAAP1 [Chthoniobacteraceae bacterium]